MTMTNIYRQLFSPLAIIDKERKKTKHGSFLNAVYETREKNHMIVTSLYYSNNTDIKSVSWIACSIIFQK